MSRGTTVCVEPDCPALTTGTRCRDHERSRNRQADRNRSAPKRTYATGDPRWRPIRQRVIREEPHCRRCSKPTTDVDHINGDATDNRRANLQGLCGDCHRHKTATVDQQRDADGRWQRNEQAQPPRPKRGSTGSVPLG